MKPSSRRQVMVGVPALVAQACLPAWGQNAVPPSPAATGSNPPPLADYFRRPATIEIVASPNGRYLATTGELFGRLNLILIDIETRKAMPLTTYDNIDVGRLQWVGDDHVLFSAIQLNAPTGQDNPHSGGLFVAARDGSGVRQLALTVRQLDRQGLGGFYALTYLRPIPDSPDEMIAAALVANDDSFDLYRVNLKNGRHRILTQGRPSDRLMRWILDSRLVPRVAVAATDGSTTGRVVYYRDSAQASWVELMRFDTTRAPAFVPLAFEADDKHLIVASNADRKNMALFSYNPQRRVVVEMLAQHPQYDLGASPLGEPLGSLIRDPRSGELLGLSVDGDTPETVWFDDGLAKAQMTIDAALPRRFNQIRRSGPGRRLVVTSFSDQLPGRYYLFDAEKRRLEEIGAARPWLEGKLAPVSRFLLPTRDGLQIPSHYVLPVDYRQGQRLPTIIHVHGGPMARDVRQGGRFGVSFGIVEAQLLAARGYAVVLPNFRITPELGSDVYYAGIGSFGRTMSDDHEDAAKWAVEQGFADGSRLCISGASYGGYAALQALTRPSNPFKCAISGLPVTDVKFQNTRADYAVDRRSIAYWKRLLGITDWDDAVVRELSPLFSVARVKAPVFMYIGDSDRRTPPEQARRMADELAKAGNPVKDFFVGRDEGHGFGVEATVAQMYERLLAFLDRYLR